MGELDKYLISFQSSRYNGLSKYQEFEFATERNLPAFEIFFDGDSPDSLADKEISTIFAMKKSGIKFSIHAPIADYNKIDDNIVNLVKFCRFLSPEFITIHFDRISYDIIDYCVNNLGTTKLSIENVIPDNNRYTNEKYVDFMCKMTKIAEIYATIDIGHLFLNGFDPIEYINTILTKNIKIKCFHIHNNFGEKDTHNALPFGKIDYNRVLRHIFNKNIYAHFVIEHWENNEISLKFFNDCLNNFIKY